MLFVTIVGRPNFEQKQLRASGVFKHLRNTGDGHDCDAESTLKQLLKDRTGNSELGDEKRPWKNK
jgi:hypothetical protein